MTNARTEMVHEVRNSKLALIPLLKEGPLRRSKIVMLSQVIGAAGVVGQVFYDSFTNRSSAASIF